MVIPVIKKQDLNAFFWGNKYVNKFPKKKRNRH